jgi:hypothetical protein
MTLALVATGCLSKPGENPSKITYNLPVTLTIRVGSELLPGSGIRYDRAADDGAHVIIKGQDALKRKGDSLDWKGTPSPWVTVDIKSRIAWYNKDELQVVGTAEIVVQGVNPQAAKIPASSLLQFSGPMTYGVGRGARLTGSLITYDGPAEEGAKLSGVAGYPYRKGGDSIFWEGTLREGVFIRIDVRVVQYDDQGLRAAGLVSLWIGS